MMQALSKVSALCLSSAALIVPTLLSRSTSPSPDHPRILLWYRTLRKPSWKPADAVIPLAWLGIESTLAAASYRLLRTPSSPARNVSLALLAGNILGIGVWSRLFFGRRNLPVSTAASAALLGGGIAYVVTARKVDSVAAVEGLPLVAWVGFATVLTAAIWRRNR